MDIIVGFVSSIDDFHTCVFSGDYNDTIMSKRVFTNLMGDQIKILSVFLGRGAVLNDIHKSLQERKIAFKTISWFQATPGQIVDAVHHFLAPASTANNFSRSVDKLLDPAQLKDNVAAKSDSQSDRPEQPDGGRKPPRRRAKPVHSA